MGYASGNRVAIRFTPEGELVEAVTSEPGGQALKVYVVDGEIVEEEIPCRLLEETRRQSLGVHVKLPGGQLAASGAVNSNIIRRCHESRRRR